MLTRRSLRAGQTAVYLLLPLLFAAAWLPLLPDRASLTIAAARGQLHPAAAAAVHDMTFSPLWHGLAALLNLFSLPPAPFAAIVSALGWGAAALLSVRRLQRDGEKWSPLLLPLLLFASPLLPAALGTAVSWQVTAVLLTIIPGSAGRRLFPSPMLLLPVFWSDWPAWLLAGWGFWRRWRETGRLSLWELLPVGALFATGSLFSSVVWGRAVSMTTFDPVAARAIMTQLAAESDFYGLALLVALGGMALSLRQGRAAVTAGLLLLGTLTLFADGLLGAALLLLAAIVSLADAGAWLQRRLEPQLTGVSAQHAGLILILLLSLPLFLAGISSVWVRYQARPLAYGALLAQAGDWFTAAGEEETVVLAPVALAVEITQPIRPFPRPSTLAEWGTFMTALNVEPPQYIVSSDAPAWDPLLRTGWFQERYREAQRFYSPEAVQSPVTVWRYVETSFDQGETIPIRVRAANGLRLAGYRYAPRAIQPGDAVHVTLDWQAAAPLQSNVDTVVRIISPVDQVGWAQRNLRTPRSWSPDWIVPETVTFSERFVLTTTNEIPIGAYQLNFSLITGRDDSFTPLFQNEDVNPIDRVLLGYVTVPWMGEIPNAAFSVGAVFGDLVTLHSYTLDGAARSGETMTATLYWEALQPPPADYTIFLHLLDGAGQFVIGFDGPPLNGRYPTRGWLPGSPVPDTHVMPLPPDLTPGEYELRVGLYLPENGERLPALDAAGSPAHDNALLLKTITVVP
jgi:hypothetical protein